MSARPPAHGPHRPLLIFLACVALAVACGTGTSDDDATQGPTSPPADDPGQNPPPAEDPGEDPPPAEDPGEDPPPAEDPGEDPPPAEDPGDPDPPPDPPDPPDPPPPPPDPAQDEACLMAAAASEGCLRVRSIHVIDESRYFVDRFGGGCRDAGEVVLLESCAPPVEACWSRIDIAGGSYGCADAADLDLFRTILRNADLPDLGLGPDHVVRRLLP